MKKKRLFTVILACALLLLCACSAPTGDTRESRERQLDAAIAKVDGWTIAAETELEGSVVSAATSEDNWATVAVFAPSERGGYQFSTSTNRHRDEIVIAGAVLGDSWYDLIWFGGAQTEYAEITYTINGQPQEPLRFGTTDMGIICIQNPEKEYTMQVVYYDSDGNRYE